MNTEVVLSHVEQGVAWLTLNRPQAINAINDAMRAALPRALAEADAREDVRVIVVASSSPRGFCVGADIKEFGLDEDKPVAWRQSRAHDHWIAAFDRVGKPVVAAVNGYCLGGGLEIALACDMRIAAEDASFAFPETGHGIIPGAGGTQRITRVLGMGVALDMVLTGEPIAAARAHALGLVSRIVPSTDLHQHVRELARRMAARPPLAMQFAKEAVKVGVDLPLIMGLRHELDLSTHLRGSEDRLEAGQAFREKRKPRFVGR